MAQNQIVSRGHTRPLTEISFVRDTADRTLLVSSAHDKLPQIRNGESGDWLGSFEGHKGAVWSCKVDPKTCSLAATASGDFSAKLWCATTGKELQEWKHKHVVKTVDFSHDSMLVATGCQNGQIAIYQTSSPATPPLELKVSADSSGAPTKLFWENGENPSMVVVGKKDGSIEKWDTKGGESGARAAVKRSLSSTGATIQDMEYHPAHKRVIVACDDKVFILNIGDLSTHQEYQMPKGMSFREEGGVSMRPDLVNFIAGGSDLWLREFEVSTGNVLRTFKGHHGPIRCVRYHPDGKMGASGSEDATIRLWDLSEEEE
jgi:serine-threonine kinase receptor-associated protein